MNSKYLFKFIPLAAAAAFALSVSPLQARPGGHSGGGHGGGGHAGHVSHGGGGHFHGGGSRGGVSFHGGHSGHAFVHGGRGGHVIVHGGRFHGRAFRGGGPYWGWGLGLGYPYYYGGYPYYSSYPYDGYYDSGVTYSDSVDSTASAVQEALAQAGYYHGAIDGIVGPGTTGAISAYQRDHGLPVTGSINASLLRSLGIS